MATTNIELDIENITGVSDADDQFIISAQKFIVSTVPRELLLFAQKASSPSTDGSAISFSVNDSIIDVQRNGYSCKEISMKEAAWALDSSSLRYVTAKHPAFYHKQGSVHFAPVTDGSNAGYIFYIDYSLINDDCDLRNVVIHYAASSEFTKLATSETVSWGDLVVPALPTLSANSVSFSTSAPGYVKPSMSLSSFPSITWTFPSVPVPSSTSAQTISAFGNVPTFTPPAMGALDFADTEDLITNEEDSEMLASRVQEISAKIQEFSARLGETQAKFNKESSIFQADVQEKIQEAQLSDAEESRKLQRFQMETVKYQSEVNKVVSGNQAEIAEWQQRNTIEIQRYGTDIQNELNKFNAENAEYQAQLQISIQNAQLSSQDDAQLLQDYGQKLQRYASEVNEMATKVSSGTQKSAHYAAESKKHYEWAHMEVTSYIQNNSKMINKTIAAEAAAK